MSVQVNYPSPQKPTESNCRIWLHWILVTFGGFLASLFWIEIGEKPDIGIIQGLIGGTLIGLTQLLVLKRYIFQAGWWVLANSLSWGLIGLSTSGWVAPKTLHILPRLLYGIIDGTQIGLLLGLGQWLVLRKQLPKAWRWIVVSILGWSISLAIGWTVGGILRLVTRLFLGEVIGLAVTWILVSAITGIALIKLLHDTL